MGLFNQMAKAFAKTILTDKAKTDNNKHDKMKQLQQFTDKGIKAFEDVYGSGNRNISDLLQLFDLLNESLNKMHEDEWIKKVYSASLDFYDAKRNEYLYIINELIEEARQNEIKKRLD